MIWFVMTIIILIGQIISIVISMDATRGMNFYEYFSSPLGIVQLLLLVAAALHVYISIVVDSNFDFIEEELNKLKNTKNKNNPQADDEGNDGSRPIEESIREGEKDSESSNAEKLQEE